MRPGLLVACLGLAAVRAWATEIAWPTSMDLRSIRSGADYLQPTVSGNPASATFGLVREEGLRFHEGVDIRPALLDGAGEPRDLIIAAMDGRVAYVDAAGRGGYGKYVVLVHPGAEVPVYTLYAHLARIDLATRVGELVRRGQKLGVMGRTAEGANRIPPERAHLHFEVGLVLSTGFNAWYDAQPDNWRTPNPHGQFNGQNLIGMDPLPVIAYPATNLLAAVRAQPTALTVALRTTRVPDFVLRHPVLAQGEIRAAAGWYVEFSWQGMPVRWTALEASDPRLPAQGWQLRELDPARRDLLVRRGMLAPDGRTPGDLLRQNVGILLSTAR